MVLTFYFFRLFKIILWVFLLHICICTPCVPGACRNQKRTTDPPELELQKTVRCFCGCWESNPLGTVSGVNQWTNSLAHKFDLLRFCMWDHVCVWLISVNIFFTFIYAFRDSVISVLKDLILCIYIYPSMSTSYFCILYIVE